MYSRWSYRLSTDRIEKKSTRHMQLCNAYGIFNLPCRTECNLDVNNTGEYLLCADRKCFCVINIESELHNDRNLRRPGEEYTPCSCSRKRKSQTSPAPCDTVLTKDFSYRTSCAATLWYPTEDASILSAGDNVVNLWNLDVPRIIYTCNVKLSDVRKLAVSPGLSVRPIIAAGLKCGSISTCDTRSSTTCNYINGFLTSEVTALCFQPHEDYFILVGYEDATVAVWDLRRHHKPLKVLANRARSTGRTIFNGCTVSYQNGYLPDYSSELSLCELQDFSNEDDVWSYVMDYGKHNPQTKKDNKMTTVDNASDIGIKNIWDVFQSKTSSSTNAVNMVAPSGSRNASTSRSEKRATKMDSTTRMQQIEREYMLKNKRRRLYSGPDSVITPIDLKPKAYSNAVRYDRPLMNAVTNNIVKDKGIPTALNCSSDRHTIFVARHKGYVEQYDARSYRFIQEFMVDRLGQPQDKHRKRDYSQSMRLLLWNEGSYVLFNNEHTIGMYDTNAKKLCGSFPAQWENHNELVNVAVQDEYTTSKKYVTDMKALPSRHEIYAINEMGELFILHPDKTKLFNVATKAESDAMDVEDN